MTTPKQMLLPFRPDELESLPSPAEVQNARAVRAAELFVLRWHQARRDRMHDAMATFRPLLELPALSAGTVKHPADIALEIRASQATVVRLAATAGIVPEIKRKGKFAKMQPITITPEFQTVLLDWYKKKRLGRANKFERRASYNHYQ